MISRSLRSRWLLSYIILIIFTAVVLDYIVSRSLRSYLLQQVQSNLESNLVLIQELVNESSMNKDYDQIAKKTG